MFGGAQEDVGEKLAAGEDRHQQVERVRVGGQRGQQRAAVGDGLGETLQVDQRPVGIGGAGQRCPEMRQQVGRCAIFRRRPGQAAQMPRGRGSVGEFDRRQEAPGIFVGAQAGQGQAALADIQLSLPPWLTDKTQ